jgi:hypothetical protein
VVGLAGGIALVVAVVAWDRVPVTGRWPRPSLSALAALVAAVLLLSQHGAGVVAIAVALVAGASLLPIVDRPAIATVQAALVVVAVALVVTASSWHLDASGRAWLAGGAVVVGVGCAVTEGQGGQLTLLAPFLVAMGGLFLCLPDTEPPLLVAGVLVPIVALLVIDDGRAHGARPRRTRSHPMPDVGAIAPALLLVALAAAGSTTHVDPRWHVSAATVGALGCAGVLVSWPAVRLARRDWPRPPRLPWLALAVVQVPTVIVIARVGAVRESVPRAALTIGLTLVVSFVVLLVAEAAIRWPAWAAPALRPR